ncbi:uncharacterized protein LOC127257620 [Andrographis paniculata]|uniref:uncharacterized protein LOC127257620 n=1 Tax=Andrographis paniculata TaxID=175694 RepID=UPI0021E94AFA|nr:uncharacterized protein LOC127257620 [Andrographis paniculata]
MDSEVTFTARAPLVFNGEGYQILAAHIQAHLESNDLWEVVEEDYEVPQLPENPTMAQIRNHTQKKTRKSKAKATLFSAVSQEIFVKIMTLKSAYEVWEFFKKEYERDERIKGMKVMNLLREFELQRMKESETMKEYSNRLLVIANKVRLFGSQLSDSRIVQKIIVTVPERFEATISSLENTKDMPRMSLIELTQALQSQEQRRLMRSEESVEGALVAKNQSTQAKKGNSNFDSHSTLKGTKPNFPPCKHCGRKGHPPFKCWKRPDQPSEFPPCNHCGKKGHPPFKCWKRPDQK